MHTKLDDICINKAAIIERAVKRIAEEYKKDPQLLNYTHIDAMTLNIERACQATIDMAMHIVSQNKLGSPQNSSDAFMLLNKANYISADTAKTMVLMTSFRNIAVHEYQELDLSILRIIAETKWKDFQTFCKELGLEILN